MCGLAGTLSTEKAIYSVYKILDSLNYRGYDSYGVLSILENGIIEDNIKGLGPISNLDINCVQNPTAKLSIGHTRWATEGEVCIKNTCPIKYGDWYCCLNGIIENYRELKHLLSLEGFKLHTSVDTEVIPALLSFYEEFDKCEPIEALKETCSKLRGQYAFIAISKKHTNKIFAACNGNPIYVTSEGFISSDIQALSGLAYRCCKLEYNNPIIIDEESLLELEYDLVIKNNIVKHK